MLKNNSFCWKSQNIYETKNQLFDYSQLNYIMSQQNNNNEEFKKNINESKFIASMIYYKNDYKNDLSNLINIKKKSMKENINN